MLDEDLSFLVETWTLRDPETGDAIATVQSKSKLVFALRHVSDIANMVYNKHEIFNPSDEKIGEIAGQLSLKDTYEVTIDESSAVPKEAVMASACVLDALESND